MSTMQRRHYKMIAQALSNARPAFNRKDNEEPLFQEIIGSLCRQLSADNPRFDSYRFAEACKKATK